VATGILWSVIIGLWAAYLVPLWIARHDTPRLHAGGGLDEAYQGDAAGDGGDGAHAVVSGDARPVARRRRTLLGLVVTLLVIVVAVPLGPMPVWAAVPAALVLGGYVVHLRRQARRVELSRRHRKSDEHPEAPTAPRPMPSAARRGRGGRARRPAGAGRRDDAQQPTDEEPSSAPMNPSLWQPLPVPLPTYVTNPGAIHPFRAVELTRAAAWSSARFGSGVAPRWHAAPTGPALSLGPDESSATSRGGTPSPVPQAQPAAASWPVPKPEVQQAVGG
jgi:hypothetical protein